MTQTKMKNGVDTIKIRKNKQKKKEFGKQVKVIERKISDMIQRNEAKLLLRVLIYHFDGFARQQQLINAYTSSKYHWGNKRTAQVLITLASIGVIDRSRSESDNWSLFFLVKGFLEKCKERIIRAGLAIKKRISHYYSAIISVDDDERSSSNLNRISVLCRETTTRVK